MNFRLWLSSLLVAAFTCTQTFAQDKLQGEVHQSNSAVRIKRPSLAPLSGAAGSGNKEHSKSLSIDIGDFEFPSRMARQTPAPVPLEMGTTSGATTIPAAENPEQAVDDRSLLIAWEEWHHRVCAALYRNWERLSTDLPLGRASTVITVTRDRHITVSVNNVEIDRSPISAVGMERAFSDRVADSVRDLDGSSVLEFPAMSRRLEVTFAPNFEKLRGGLPGYEWKHGDFERVPMR